ncbi:phage/plasmid-associated DNA primase [Pantoea alhagi]|uniref:primase-like DNA-binding domain-containing protein n=1 Tax=Mixta sp. BE291 TaxID=3158787 RepID=UPI00285F8925|nr:phage/plasmid-associated DNA primase [Pantoea alhagi]
MDKAEGLMMGRGSYIKLEPKKYLYHLYLAFAEYNGIKPLAVSNFGKAIAAAAREFGAEYLTRTINGRRQTNVGIGEAAEEFLPRAYGVDSPDDSDKSF